MAKIRSKHSDLLNYFIYDDKDLSREYVRKSKKFLKSIKIKKKDKINTTLGRDELKLKQVNELLQVHLIRRKVDPRVLSIKNSENAAGSSIRQVSELEEGISQENAKKIITEIKKLKLKIQIKIQGEELRAEGKKRDDLQEAMSAISAIDIGLPIEFVNFRD